MAPGKSPSSLWSVLKKLVKKGKLWSKGGPPVLLGEQKRLVKEGRLVPKGGPSWTPSGGDDATGGEEGVEPAGASYKVGDFSYRLPG